MNNSVNNMRYYILLGFLIAAVSATGNDGAFFSSGGQLFPKKETVISLKKEILNFRKVEQDYISVRVHFEFFNPGPEKEVLVGFESPGSGGAEVSDSSYIKNFTVVHDGKTLEFRHTTEPARKPKDDDCEDCGWIRKHIFSFKAVFRPGVNIIDHAYEYKGASSVSYDYRYDYILTTGKRWANTKIEDFTLNIDLGSNVTFVLPASFGKNNKADWIINGTGKSRIYNVDMYEERNTKKTFFYIKNGSVSLHMNDFRPDKELDITMFRNSFDLYNRTLWSGFEIKDGFITKLANLINESLEDPSALPDRLSPDDLRKLKNYFYAGHGFYFKDEKLRNFYDRYEWYLPDPELKFEDIILSEEEIKLIGKIREIEKSREAGAKKAGD
ncbi:MAG TPA: YARHG domain-containing protein [Ignavibacteriales bacterium]|nr:YARHG domain-containing protein [Ignavibacteriales bacterium]